MKPYLLLLLLLCTACESDAESSTVSETKNRVQVIEKPPASLSDARSQGAAIEQKQQLPDNPLEALAYLSPAQRTSLRKALLTSSHEKPKNPELARVQSFVLAFLQSHYRTMLHPPVARRDKLPAGSRAVKLLSHDGLPLQAAYVPAKKPSRQTVILLHGYGSHLSYTWIKYSFLHSDYNLLLLDQRGHNGQSGAVTLGVFEARDLLSAIRWLSTQQQEGFALVGESLGAAVAISGGARWVNSPEQQVFALKGVWSDAAYADLQHAISERAVTRLKFEAPGLSEETRNQVAELFTEIFLSWLARDTGVKDVEAAAAPIQYLPALATHVPVALVHSNQDEETSYQNAERLAKTLSDQGQPNALWTTHGLHADSWKQPEYQKRLKTFLAEVFKR